MNNALTTTIIAVSGASLICILVSQIQNRRPRGRPGGSARSDGGDYAGGDGGSHFSGAGDTGHGESHHPTGPDNSADSGGSDSGEVMAGEAATAVAAAFNGPALFQQDRQCR
jgi:hypothetical protein